LTVVAKNSTKTRYVDSGSFTVIEFGTKRTGAYVMISS